MGSMPTAIIPAAGLGLRMLPISGKMPKAMIPVDGRPIISWILNRLLQQGVGKIIIIVGEKKELLIDYVNRLYGGRTEIIYVTQENLTGPLGAIGLAQSYVTTKDQLIILGDTIIQDELSFERSWVLYHPVSDYWRWCLVESHNNFAVRFIDKPNSPVATNKALVGAYYLESTKLWQKCITYVLGQDLKIQNEFQISSALEKYNKEIPIETRLCTKWFDCGSIDNYYRTRGELINSRSFNRIQVDTKVGTLRKWSTRNGKLIDEINWYLRLPKECQILTPRIIDYSTDEDKAYATFEYYGYQTLSELYLFENVHGKVWENILERLFSLVHDYLHSKQIDGNAVSEAVYNMYWEKTKKRIADSTLSFFQYEEVILNNCKLKGWPIIKSAVERICKLLSEKVSWTIIHGDLCFPNILFDVETGLIRFVDPRGKFGNVHGIYGDCRYDMAKLYHSVHGGYDFIINDLFDVKETGLNEYKLEVYKASQHHSVEKLVSELIKKYGFEMKEIRFIQALLFLSMVPLHADSAKRQLAFSLIGTKILNDTLEEWL